MALICRIWKLLNQIPPERLLGQCRVYGGGLHKLEPNELSDLDAAAIAGLIPGFQPNFKGRQLDLFGDHESLSA